MLNALLALLGAPLPHAVLERNTLQPINATDDDAAEAAFRAFHAINEADDNANKADFIGGNATVHKLGSIYDETASDPNFALIRPGVYCLSASRYPENRVRYGRYEWTHGNYVPLMEYCANDENKDGRMNCNRHDCNEWEKYELFRYPGHGGAIGWFGLRSKRNGMWMRDDGNHGIKSDRSWFQSHESFRLRVSELPHARK